MIALLLALQDFTNVQDFDREPAGRAAFYDVDDDGWPDVVLDRRRLWWNRQGRFERGPDFPEGPVVLFADGLLFAGRIHRWNGTAFEEVADSGVDAPTATAAAWLDYDRDGVLDLFVGFWYRHYGESLECDSSRLYRGLGGGRFEDVTERAGLFTVDEVGRSDSSRPVYGLSTLDVDADGWTDVFVCVYGRQANRLYRNNGDGTFTDVAPDLGVDGDEIRHGRYPPQVNRPAEAEFRSHGNTFSAACGDFDNDGDMDLFLAEITHWWAGDSADLSCLLVNDGTRFARRPDAIPRVHAAPDWNQGDIYAAWMDADSDGRLDLLLGSSDYPDGQYLRLFRQREDGSFEDVTRFDWEGSGQISLGDYDRDGRMDILVGKSFMRLPAERTEGRVPVAGLFHNESPARSWIGFRAPIGTRVRAAGQTREVAGAAGHAGSIHDPWLHFGLGDAADPLPAEIVWPDGTRETTPALSPGRYYELRRGEPPRPWAP